MLAKYYRLRAKWEGDQTLTYDSGARIAIRLSPWKLVGGILTYGTTITEDLGFGAGETIATGVSVEGSVIDNTANLYYGIKGYFEATADVSGTDGIFTLMVEESDDDTNWPSDQDDFNAKEDLRVIGVLGFSTGGVDWSRAINFEI